MSDDSQHDPLETERDRAKRDEELPDAGPPVSQMATTFGSSFVSSQEEAEEIARDASEEAERERD